MAKFRVNKTANYTVMSNFHLRDRRLSLKAKGMLSMILSLPDNWHYSIGGLVSICNEKETAVTSALKELKETGYIVVTKMPPSQTASGRFEYVYDIYERPAAKQGHEKQGVENLGVENLCLENLGVENPGLYKDTDKQSKDNKVSNINNRPDQGEAPETPGFRYDEKAIEERFKGAHDLCSQLFGRGPYE